MPAIISMMIAMKMKMNRVDSRWAFTARRAVLQQFVRHFAAVGAALGAGAVTQDDCIEWDAVALASVREATFAIELGPGTGVAVRTAGAVAEHLLVTPIRYPLAGAWRSSWLRSRPFGYGLFGWHAIAPCDSGNLLDP